MPKYNLEKINEMFNINYTDEEDTSKKEIENKVEEYDKIELEIEKLLPFPEHKFKLYEGERLNSMTESIKANGIIVPIIVWKKENEYIILSGHNRVHAGKIAGLTKVPAIIKENLTKDEAVLIVTETNLCQRSFTDLSYSERAFSLKQHYEAVKKQGKRNDIINEIETLLKTQKFNENSTSGQIDHKLKTREIISGEYGLSSKNTARYLKIASLKGELLNKLDNDDIGFIAAYEISFINDVQKQEYINNLIDEGNKLDIKKAALLHKYYNEGKLNNKIIDEILSGKKNTKPKGNQTGQIKLKQKIVKKYFKPEQTASEIEETIDKALEFYFNSINE